MGCRVDTSCDNQNSVSQCVIVSLPDATSYDKYTFYLKVQGTQPFQSESRKYVKHVFNFQILLMQTLFFIFCKYLLNSFFKDTYFVIYGIISEFTDKVQFHYLTKLKGPQVGNYLYTTQFLLLR